MALRVVACVLMVTGLAGWVASAGARATEDDLVVFLRGSSIWIMRPDGTGQRRLTRPRIIREGAGPAGRGDSHPAWSPDRRRIAFSRAEESGVAGLWVMNADGTEARRILRPAKSRGRYAVAFEPAWSPDGSRIAYVNWSEFPGIWVANADGSGATSITNSVRDSSPAWSPDGERLAFVRCRMTYDIGQSARCQIHVVNANGTGVRPLVPLPRRGGWDGDSDPDWSPDGKWLSFTRWAGDRAPRTGTSTAGRLYLVDTNGQTIRRLIPTRSSAGTDFAPNWSPDGRRIVFVRGYPTERGYRFNINVVNPDGTNVRRLTRDPRSEGSPDW